MTILVLKDVHGKEFRINSDFIASYETHADYTLIKTKDGEYIHAGIAVEDLDNLIYKANIEIVRQN